MGQLRQRIWKNIQMLVTKIVWRKRHRIPRWPLTSIRPTQLVVVVVKSSRKWMQSRQGYVNIAASDVGCITTEELNRAYASAKLHNRLKFVVKYIFGSICQVALPLQRKHIVAVSRSFWIGSTPNFNGFIPLYFTLMCNKQTRLTKRSLDNDCLWIAVVHNPTRFHKITWNVFRVILFTHRQTDKQTPRHTLAITLPPFGNSIGNASSTTNRYRRPSLQSCRSALQCSFAGRSIAVTKRSLSYGKADTNVVQ